MEGRATVHCRQCCESIASGDSFFCFKAPGKETYVVLSLPVRPAIVGTATGDAEVTPGIRRLRPRTGD